MPTRIVNPTDHLGRSLTRQIAGGRLNNVGKAERAVLNLREREEGEEKAKLDFPVESSFPDLPYPRRRHQ